MTRVIPQFISLDNYDYSLPENNIAKFPIENRDQSKLLIYNKGKLLHDNFCNLTNYLPQKSHLVFNNTRVIPARLNLITGTGAKIEIFLLKPISINANMDEVLNSTSNCIWQCMIGNKKRWRNNEILTLFQPSTNFDFFAEIIDFDNNTIKFQWKSNSSEYSFNEVLNLIGQIPLPPYIDRLPNNIDKETYQTVYSETLGAVAAPTAGLHFTQQVFEKLEKFNHSIQNITLHVGAGTFLPIKVENVLNHKMHNEQIIFNKNGINDIIKKLDHIIAVGTTSMRALESLYWYGVKLILNKDAFNVEGNSFFIEKLYPYNFDSEISPIESLSAVVSFMDDNKYNQLIGETEIFIFPGYNFKICKGLITNFHQPKSTLLLLIAALIGDNWKVVYDAALQNNYRFLSYGDSSLLLP